MEEADIVVVGAGSGGCAAAGRRAADSRYSVALLETGGRGGRDGWPDETVPQPGLGGRRGYQPRGRGLGGSSAIGAMLYVRGSPFDYDRWTALGCTGWSWNAVLPVFRRAERNARGADAWHGDGGPVRVGDPAHPHAASLDFVAAAVAAGIAPNADFNGAQQDGAGLYQVTRRDGARWDAARAYLDPAPRNLAIHRGVLAERVLFEDGRAWGVACRRGGTQTLIRARRAVVLAAGVFGTPQLLMLSGIGPGAHLAGLGVPVRIDRPAVGTDLQDHLACGVAFELPGAAPPVAPAVALLSRLLRRDRAVPGAEAGAFLRIDPAAPAPDVQLHFVPAVVEDHGRADVRDGFTCHAAVLRPESRGTVRLASPDAAAAPLIDPGFLSAPADLALLREGVRAVYRILAEEPLARHGARDRSPVDPADDVALERLIRARADSIYHPVGTARMGGDGAAVCDPRLRVRGVAGLYVADSSVMPRLVSGDTGAATVMIGERAADFVRSDLG